MTAQLSVLAVHGSMCSTFHSSILSLEEILDAHGCEHSLGTYSHHSGTAVHKMEDELSDHGMWCTPNTVCPLRPCRISAFCVAQIPVRKAGSRVDRFRREEVNALV